MAENKTKPTKVSVAAFIAKVANEQRRKDSKELVKLFKELTGKPAKMWGPSIIGFDSYHYVYESGREGDAPLSRLIISETGLINVEIAGPSLLKQLATSVSLMLRLASIYNLVSAANIRPFAGNSHQ